MPLKLNKTTDATTRAVSDVEHKLHSKIDLTDDDALVTSLNIAVENYVGDRLQRAFTNETWTLHLNELPPSSCPIEICRVPLASVTTFKYIDTDGTEQTLAADQYIVDNKREPAAIERAYQVTWPSTRNIVNAVEVTFVAGYGAASSTVPDEFKTIMKQMFTHLYRHREPVTEREWKNLPAHMEALFYKYELKVFG